MHPACQAVAVEGGHGHCVVDIEVWSGDKGTTGRDVDRAEVIGFDLAPGFIDEATQCLEVAFRFE